ncbi:MAG: adenylate/guanylate cyclase domain-containing protein, partial [Leptospiraceae bacterium]|nr:adenylate/guanylate cyclase domain-containing protein [Leptospiraceae bacterium]
MNILPGRIVDRLKTNPGFLAERFDEATIMFADIVDFTVLSEKMSPPDLVQMLDRIFREFDLLADKLQLEKIKTIGDAYMIAGGVPIARADHTAAVARMALEMQNIMRTELGDLGLRLRVGIHCGPIVAGVIGHRKFIYDLWGDTVNTASRMESHGVIGEIQVTEAVYTRLKDEFDFEARGPIAVKGK